MDFINDYDESLINELQKFGYRKKTEHKMVDRFCLWHEQIRKQIPIKKYRVHFSAELLGNSLYEKYSLAINEIKNCFIAGKSVVPYLSDKAEQLYGKDLLLNFWKIHHFHLNPIVTKNQDGKVKRSKHVLFAQVEDEDVYFIDINKHTNNGEFENIALLETLDRNWPELLMTLNGMRPSMNEKDLTQENIRKLRQSNVNHMFSVNGRVVMPSLGVTSAGGSAEAVHDVMRFCRDLDWLEKSIRSDPHKFFNIPFGCRWLNVKLVGCWEKGFDILEMTTQQRVRVKTEPD